jgi:hypothetical protein
MCFVFIWEQRATCATYSINWLVFITEMKSVYSAVRTGPLNTAVCVWSLKGRSTINCRICAHDNLKWTNTITLSSSIFTLLTDYLVLLACRECSLRWPNKMLCTVHQILMFRWQCILANDQLDAQILLNTFITTLYMFRAIFCSSSGGQIVLIQHLVSSLSVSDRPVHRLRKKKILLETCRGL